MISALYRAWVQTTRGVSLACMFMLGFCQPMKAQGDRFWGLHMDFHASPSDTLLVPAADSVRHYQRFARFLQEVQPDYLQVDSKGHVGYTSWPSRYGSQAGLIGYDPLKLWSRVAHEQKRPLWIHYSGVQDGAAITKHPNWAALNPEGKPYPKATSMLSPYVDSLMIPQLVEAWQRYGLQGVWIDGDCWGQELDYHPRQQARFLAENPDLKQAPKPGEAGYDRWVAFQRAQFYTYLRHVRTELAQRAPGFRMISNWAFSSHIPLPKLPELAELSGDLSPLDAVNAAHFEGRFLRVQTPYWDIMLWGHARNFATGFRSLKTVAQIRQEAAHILALGGGVEAFYNMQRDGGPGATVLPLARNLSRYVRAWRGKTAYHHPNWKSAAEVAVLVPSLSVMRQMGQNKSLYRAYNGEYDEMLGLTQALQEAGLSFDYVLEDQAAERLSSYRYCVVPDCDTLTAAAVKALLAFQGPVVVTGPRSAHLLASKLDLPRLRPEKMSKSLLWVHEDSLAMGVMTELAPLPASHSGTAGHFLSPSYTHTHPKAVAGSYRKGLWFMTLFPLGKEYKKHAQNTLATLLKDELTRTRPSQICLRQGMVSLVPYQRGKEKYVFLANREGQHSHPDVYQQASIPAAGPVRLFVAGAKPQQSAVWPQTPHTWVPVKGGWELRIAQVESLIRVSWR